MLILEERKGEIERNIEWLPPVRSLTGNQTHKFLVYGMMLQPSEPPGQAAKILFRKLKDYLGRVYKIVVTDIHVFHYKTMHLCKKEKHPKKAGGMFMACEVKV